MEPGVLCPARLNFQTLKKVNLPVLLPFLLSYTMSYNYLIFDQIYGTDKKIRKLNELQNM